MFTCPKFVTFEATRVGLMQAKLKRDRDDMDVWAYLNGNAGAFELISPMLYEMSMGRTNVFLETHRRHPDVDAVCSRTCGVGALYAVKDKGFAFMHSPEPDAVIAHGRPNDTVVWIYMW